MELFGASFSVPYAQYLGLDPKACMRAAIEDLGVRRFRLMSYWNRLEPRPGEYDWRELDWQIDMAENAGAEVTLCLGLRQPRWPENHWPDWARDTPDAVWQPVLLAFIEAVVNRYKDKKCIVSYQLENEALLKSFGQHGNYDRARLRREYALVKRLDPGRPIIMTTSDAWGIPWIGPIPDIVGFSIYRYLYDEKKGRYVASTRSARFYRLRAGLIRLLRRRPVYIHELQAEPWGPRPIPDMSLDEQFKSMNPERVEEAVEYARATTLLPADVWGLEWWYWLRIKHDSPVIWNYMTEVFHQRAASHEKNKK